MAATLYINGSAVPTNLHLRESNGVSTRVRLVTQDLFHIAERIHEISDRLFIVELEENSKEGQKFGLAIMENTPDRGAFLIFRTTLDKLDDRVLKRLKYIMSVDLHTRLAILDKEREKWEKEQEDDAMEELYERMGGPMWVELEKNGFIQRPVSYRPMNPTARRAGRRMNYDK
jgi:hypothetical protein